MEQFSPDIRSLINTNIYEYWFTSLSAQSWHYRDRRKPEAGTMPYSYFECLQGFFIVHGTIGSSVHSMTLNSLEHCICTTTMTNIHPDRDSSLVPPGYKPQSIRMSHRGWPINTNNNVVCVYDQHNILYYYYRHILVMVYINQYISLSFSAAVGSICLE